MRETRVRLTDLSEGEAGTIDEILLPEEDQQFLMRIGFVPGTEVQFCRSAPLGDPKVYMIDGTQVALRTETAARVFVSRSTSPGEGA